MKVRFVGSFLENFPCDGRKHAVFVGRSNVGKSSLINMLVGQKVAKVSKEPGRTRAINFFLLEDQGIYLVDLPGYGFAKVSKVERERWRVVIDAYFRTCKDDIKVVFLLIDCVVGPTELDLQALDWLKALGIRCVLTLTKCDRATQEDINKTIKSLGQNKEIVITSSKEGRGKKDVLSYVLN
ncbi:MAG: ribosome biogenesis GTP-binding protein YihA/YsxC [Aquificaceae bacterium]|nr:ribosome biogenesis GTP-binding protein YihA/YsxC [Aquificaceae bacterium]